MSRNLQSSDATVVLDPPIFDEEEAYFPKAWEYQEEYYDDSAPQAPLVSVVGASGGVGRSTIALCAAFLAAQSGIDTVLIEGDLHFGDYGFWLGLDDELPNLADECAEPIHLAQNLDFYKAPVFPEFADEVADSIIAQLGFIRSNRGLVIVDTGAFWSGFVADLLLQSNAFLMLVDNRPSSVAGAVRACELCSRIQVPLVRMLAVYNKWNSRLRISAHEAQKALGAHEMFCIPDGKGVVDELISSGNFEELLEIDNPMIQGVKELLTSLLPRVGHLYSDAPLKNKGGLFWRD